MPKPNIPEFLDRIGLKGLHRSTTFADSKAGLPMWHSIDDTEAWRSHPYVRLQPKHSLNMIFADLDIDHERSAAIVELLRLEGLAPSMTTQQRLDSAQASWFLKDPIHLDSPRRRVRTRFAPIIFYKSITRALRKTVLASTAGHGRSRQRNPLFQRNNGASIIGGNYSQPYDTTRHTAASAWHEGYTLTDIASAIGYNKREAQRESEHVDHTLAFTRETTTTTPFGTRSKAPYESRLASALTEARYTYSHRHQFIALRVMRGFYHLAHDIGPNVEPLWSIISTVNDALPTPFAAGEPGGVECIVQGIVDSFESGKIYGMKSSTRASHAVHVAGGRASAAKSKARVKERNNFVLQRHLNGETASEINESLVREGYKRLSGGMISKIIKSQKPLTTSKAQRDQSIIRQWMSCRDFTDIAQRNQVCRQTVTQVILRHIEKTARAGILLYLPPKVKMTRPIREKIKDTQVNILML